MISTDAIAVLGSSVEQTIQSEKGCVFDQLGTHFNLYKQFLKNVEHFFFIGDDVYFQIKFIHTSHLIKI